MAPFVVKAACGVFVVFIRDAILKGLAGSAVGGLNLSLASATPPASGKEAPAPITSKDLDVLVDELLFEA
jgi:hypothetical protein